jgi:hypothetical protein
MPLEVLILNGLSHGLAVALACAPLRLCPPNSLAALSQVHRIFWPGLQDDRLARLHFESNEGMTMHRRANCCAVTRFSAAPKRLRESVGNPGRTDTSPRTLMTIFP